MPKKIIIFSVAYYPKFVGGAEVAVKEITDRLPTQGDHGYEFHLLTLRLDKNLPKEEKIGNVYVYRLGFVGEVKETADSLRFPLHYNKYLFPFLSCFKALRLSKRMSFDFIWSIMANYSGFGALFFKLFRSDIPFLLTLQEGDPIQYIKKRVSILYPVFKLIFTKADYIQAISYYLGNFGKSMGFKGNPHIIANGVDIAHFSQDFSQEEIIKTKNELGLKTGDIALVTASRLAVKNGIGDVIKSLKLLPENIKFIIIGDGYMHDELQKLAKDLEVHNRVVFKGYIPHKDLPKYLKACDVFIRPSLSEGLGNSFIEAMAAGIPVIATPVGGIVDFLFEGKTGYLCKPENPESIKETVNMVLSDPHREAIVSNAKEMAKEKYDWGNITMQIKAIFDKIGR